jgi:transposase-like protein
VYREHNVKATLFYRLTDGEWEEEVREDLENIMRLGVKIESVTCDGLSNILKAVRKASPTITIQRCLAHIQRKCLTKLTRHPQTDAGQALRIIIKRLYTTYNREKRGYWVVELVRWYGQYKDFVNQKTFKEETGR